MENKIIDDKVIKSNLNKLKDLPLSRKANILKACDELIEIMGDDSSSNGMCEDPVGNRVYSESLAMVICSYLGIKTTFQKSDIFPNLCNTMTIGWGDDEPFSDCAIDRGGLIDELSTIKLALKIPGVC